MKRSFFHPMRNAVSAALTAAAIVVAASTQASILYFDEFTSIDDPIETALVNLGLSFTEVTNETDFNNEITSNPFDLVIFLEESLPRLSARTNVETFINGGGKAIYNSFTPGAFASVFDAVAGTVNSTNVTVTDPVLAAGLGSASFSLVNPTFGVFSVELTAASGGVTGGTLGGGSAVIFGNDGRTIMNGFLTETFPSLDDEVRFYENEISLLMGTTPVPLPASLPLAAAGLGLMAAVARSRRARA